MKLTKVMMNVMQGTGARACCLRSFGGGTRPGRHLACGLALITSISFITFITASAVFAAEKPFAAPEAADRVAPSDAGNLFQVTLSLLIVLAAVFAAAWVVRRMRGFGKAGAGAVQIIADVPLGTKERAVLVQVGRQQLLLGVAPGRVSTLHVLSEHVAVNRGDLTAEGVETASRVGPDFKAVLKRSLGL